MNYHHFTIEERCCLREYYVKGKSRMTSPLTFQARIKSDSLYLHPRKRT